jgi:N-methylhydantoinase A/oxoprolinase/acetone carboxylase beta subunit
VKQMRRAHFAGRWIDCDVHTLENLPRDERLDGPAIIESPSTTVVLPEEAWLIRGRLGSLLISPMGEALAP